MGNVKGTTDYRGEEQRLRNRIRGVLERQFALYDFEPMETPVLNERTLLTSKYAGGEEIVKEMYVLSDQGGRQLGLRYDLTVPFAKVVAATPGLPRPYRRYEIGKVFRDGPVKRGRLREFTQCDADVAGVEGPEAEAELMLLAAGAFRELGIGAVCRWNNRRFLGELLSRLGVDEADAPAVMLALDKLDKIGADDVAAELGGIGLAGETIGRIAAWIESAYGNGNGGAADFESLVRRYGLADTPGTREVRRLEKLIDAVGLDEVCAFDPFLSRGLSFYTGTVYEWFAADGSLRSSVASGGRYDAMIGTLAADGEGAVPAVGLSFGLDAILELYRERGTRDERPAVRFVPLGDTLADTLRAAALFRSAGVRAGIESAGRKLKRALAAASAQGVRFVVIVGEDEAAAGRVRLKDLTTGEETDVSAECALYRVERATKGSLNEEGFDRPTDPR
ncbi:histidine--tRNA ligase [Paenibacillus flagellatus]|uniref:Histidine--tRNA ligase n=1 Tax=Paenibacillus flagellatus TaxID=2211139 RepID=A0A2V5KGC0_9BACL|nr:histidine--tRNA ligase [Paenibacillus flagellatus]PYI57353.1 histidine--tRNA ligase [Paenibacillus flagellatus]